MKEDEAVGSGNRMMFEDKFIRMSQADEKGE